MRFDDFLAQAHANPVPWAWAVRISVNPDDDGKPWSAVWRHSIHSTKAEVEQWLRDHDHSWLREDARLDVVKIRFVVEQIETSGEPVA